MLTTTAKRRRCKEPTETLHARQTRLVLFLEKRSPPQPRCVYLRLPDSMLRLICTFLGRKDAIFAVMCAQRRWGVYRYLIDWRNVYLRDFNMCSPILFPDHIPTRLDWYFKCKAVAATLINAFDSHPVIRKIDIDALVAHESTKIYLDDTVPDYGDFELATSAAYICSRLGHEGKFDFAVRLLSQTDRYHIVDLARTIDAIRFEHLTGRYILHYPVMAHRIVLDSKWVGLRDMRPILAFLVATLNACPSRWRNTDGDIVMALTLYRLDQPG